MRIEGERSHDPRSRVTLMHSSLESSFYRLALPDVGCERAAARLHEHGEKLGDNTSALNEHNHCLNCLTHQFEIVCTQQERRAQLWRQQQQQPQVSFQSAITVT
jgi:hypothetical protein